MNRNGWLTFIGIYTSETWGLKGIPDSPEGWLYTVAKNKAKDALRRKSLFHNKIELEIKHKPIYEAEIDIDLSVNNIRDSQLKMLFAVCNPLISEEAQITLALQILCGFGIEEIANAFVSNKSTINKRLFRAKEVFKKEAIKLELPPEKAILNRLSNVLSILYLLFNEGYYSRTSQQAIRKDMCWEAMRLLNSLLESNTYNLPECQALMALFCFHASRFEARTNELGEYVLYQEQNHEKWNSELIVKGEYFLNSSAKGNSISKYHLEAAIAYWHTRPADNKEKWEQILQHYNMLLQLQYSPMAALNRTYAFAKVRGKEAALKEALKIDLKGNHLFHSLVGELYRGIDPQKVKEHLQIALSLSKTEAEKKLLQEKLDSLL